MSEAALVSVVALLGWLVLVWRSGTLRSIGNGRKMAWAATWIAIFVTIALVIRLLA